MEKHPLIVIGGGPAGLFCALKAAELGRKILLVEKMPRPGRKLLLSGSGQCNITHEEEPASFLSHYGENGRFLKPSLMNFQSRDLISFFAGRGLPLMTEPGGKVFPRSRKASDILNLLIRESEDAGVEIRCGDPVLDISVRDDGFSIRTDQGTRLAGQLVIATGGITYPATGSTGDGYVFARSLGHRVTETSPALVGVAVRDYGFSDRAGISFSNADISLIRAGRKIKQRAGDLLLTHSGLSGPGILDLSRHIRPGDTLRVSFLPGLDPTEVEKTLLDRVAAAGNARIRTALAAYHLPERFINKVLTLAGIERDLTGAHLSREKRSALIELLTRCPFTVDRLGGIHEAMVTRGGVSLDEINPKTMESRLVPRLYFVGEVLDIDGDTGGYNLQAAFATAALAARRIVELFSEPS